MKKNIWNYHFIPKSQLYKTLICMKLSFLLGLIFSLQLFAKVHSQTITIKEKNQSLEQVLRKIEQQTHYRFLYNNDVLSNKIQDLDLRNAGIKEALDQILSYYDLEYTITNNNLVILSHTDKRQLILTGKVVDEKNSPLPGVTIQEKGTGNGTVTDSEGFFQIKLSSKNSVLIFSFLGFEKQELQIGDKTNITVVLQSESKSLNEIVVIGYGTQKKSDLTGAISSVDPKKLIGLPLTDVTQAIQGQVSGVKVRRNGGEPGGEFNVYIRGVNSASGDSQPLYVVDGVPIASGSLNTLNPEEVDNIEVLKDASATAIYGSRAANGVVIVTTKMAKKGQPTLVNFNVEQGIQHAVIPFKMMDSFEQADLAKEAYAEIGLSIPSELNDKNFLANNNNNWYDLATRTAYTNKSNLQISGSSDKTQFMVGASYSNNQGVLIESYNKNATLRVNLDHQASEKFRFGGRIAGGYNKGTDFISGQFYNTPWRLVTYIRPWIPGKDANGNYIPVKKVGIYEGISENPIARFEDEDRYRTQYSFNGNLYGEYNIISSLKLKYLGGLEYFSNGLYDLDPIYDRGDYNNPTVKIQNNNQATVNWLSDLTLTYDKLIGVNHFTLLGGLSVQKFTINTVNVSADGANSNALDQLSGQLNYSASGVPVSTGLFSYFGRAFYSYKGKYLFTGTLREDGSSRFGPENKWGTFPSASVGWLISEESFMKNFNWLSNLKLRSSYGLTGNQDIPNFRYIGLADVNNYANGNTIVPGFSVTNPANPAIRWESQKQTDIGFDLGLYKNRFTFTVDYYKKISDGLLTNQQLAPSTGFTGTLTKNAGKISNQGWEFSISSNNIDKKLKWNTNLNFSFNTNNVLDLGVDNNGNPVVLSGINFGVPIGSVATVTTAGHPISSFYGYIFDGIYQANEASEAQAINPILKPGDKKYRDINHDGKINAADRTFIGNSSPKFFGGLTNNFNYQAFSLSIFADFASGSSVLNSQRFFSESSVFDLWQSKAMLNRYTPANPSNEYPRAEKSTQSWNSQVSSYFVENADFIRINNVTLGYKIPDNMARKFKVKSAFIALSGNNLYTFTTYKGWNPESNTRTEPLSQGIDTGSYPLSRSYVVRLDITF